MSKDYKESATSVGGIAPVVDYADGPANYHLAPQYKRKITLRQDGDTISLDADGDTNFPDDDQDQGKNKDENNKKPIVIIKGPSLEDIELISNELVSDIANNPTVTLVFKIRNSSGQAIKGIKYRTSIQ